MQTKVYIFSQKIAFYGKTHRKIAVRLTGKLFSQVAKSMNADLERTELFDNKGSGD